MGDGNVALKISEGSVEIRLLHPLHRFQAEKRNKENSEFETYFQETKFLSSISCGS